MSIGLKKRMFSKILLGMAACLFILTLISPRASAAADTGFSVDGVSYNMLNKKTVEVTSKAGGFYSGSINIPDTVNYGNKTYKVIQIGLNAFCGCADLSEVKVGSNVQTILDNAFSGCSKLSVISLGSNVTSIGISAFKGCSSLTEVALPSGIDEISQNLFADCASLKDIVFLSEAPPDHVYNNTFQNVPAGLKVYVPNAALSSYKACIELKNYLPSGYQILPYYTVTIGTSKNGSGSGGGLYKSGDTVVLSAKPDSGYNFDGWYNSSTLVSVLPNYTFKPTMDITLVPRFSGLPSSTLSISYSGNGYISFNDTLLTTSEKVMKEGTDYKLTARAAGGWYFAYWEDVTTSTVLSTNPVYESILGSDCSIRAVFYETPSASTVYFKVLFIDKNGKILKSIIAFKGSSASPPADPTVSGYVFKGWNTSYDNVTSNLIITAVYERTPVKYTVKINKGTLSTGETTGDFEFDMPVNVSANPPEPGKKFSYWEQDGRKISISPTLTIYMPMKLTTLTAVYSNDQTKIEIVPFITLSDIAYTDKINRTISFTATRFIPEGFKLVESGILMLQSNYAVTELNIGTPRVILGKIKNDSTNEFYIRKKNISQGTKLYARAYLRYMDSNNNLVTVYSDNIVSAAI